MNNKGNVSGLALILILVVALLVAFLAVRNMDSLELDNPTPQQGKYVQQAQDLVDQINKARQYPQCH